MWVLYLGTTRSSSDGLFPSSVSRMLLTHSLECHCIGGGAGAYPLGLSCWVASPVSSECPVSWWDCQMVRAKATNQLARLWAGATKRPDGQTDQNSHLATSFLEMQKGCPRGPRRPNLELNLLWAGDWAVTLARVPTSSVLFSPPTYLHILGFDQPHGQQLLGKTPLTFKPLWSPSFILCWYRELCTLWK